MNCKRCNGLMNEKLLYDINDQTGQIWLGVWQCLNCGEVVDPLILQNRKVLPDPSYRKPRLKTANTVLASRLEAHLVDRDHGGFTKSQI